MERDVILVSFDVDSGKYSRLSVGNASLLAALERHGHGCALLMPRWSGPQGDGPTAIADSLLKALAVEPTDRRDLAFGVYVWNDAVVRQVLSALSRRGLRNRVILGGPQITNTPRGQLEANYPEADVFVRGEGEDALAAIVGTLAPVSLPGVHFAGTEDDDSVAFIENLGRLPSPCFSRLRIPVERCGRTRWETKRGCPYHCGFCQHALRSGGVREFPRRRLQAEIGHFVESGVWMLTVLDPTFNIGPSSLWVLGELRRSGYRGKVSVQCRFESLRTEFIEAAAQLDICLEFGLQTIIPEECCAIGRQNDVEKIARWMDRMATAGIHFEADLMYALPHQTVDSFRRSVDFCRTRGVPVRCHSLSLLRGTTLDQDRGRWGLVTEAPDNTEVVAGPTFTREDKARMDGIAADLRAEWKVRHTAWEGMLLTPLGPVAA